MKKDKNEMRTNAAFKEAEAVVKESEQLMIDLMHVMGQHTHVEHPSLVALMGLSSTVAEIVKMLESVGFADAQEKFLFLLTSELTLREALDNKPLELCSLATEGTQE